MTNIAAGDDPNAARVVETMWGEFAGDVRLSKALYDIAARYERNRKYKQAKAIYELIIEVDANSVEAGSAELQMAKADVLALVDEGKDDQVHSRIDTLIADFNKHPGLGQAIFDIGEKYYGQAFVLENDGFTAKSKEDFGKCIGIWERIVTDLSESDTVAKALHLSADCYRRLGRYEKAIEYYREIIANQQGYEYAGVAQFLIGYSYKKMKQAGVIAAPQADEEMRAAYETVVQDYPLCPFRKAAQDWLECNRKQD